MNIHNMIFVSLLLIGCASAADKMTATQLIELARFHRADIGAAIAASFGEEDLKNGTAWMGHKGDFFFATESSSKPALLIDDAPGPQMQNIDSSNLWYAVAQLSGLGKLHSFYYLVQGKRFGGSLDVPAYGPLSELLPGVHSGSLSKTIAHTSKIYDGMKSDYWIYAPAQYDPKTPAALMVFQDGDTYIQDRVSVLNAIDNLIAQKTIPVMICVFINPGDISGSPGTSTYNFVKAYGTKWNRDLAESMRSVLYDTVSDRYARFLRDEILADVERKYNVRKDSYSRAIMGLSSGGICSFNVAWQMPEQFSRVISWIGSFTSIQWKETPDVPDGGQDYPDKVLREAHRNIRVWLQDGSNDMADGFYASRYGDWPLSNSRMANALKNRGYDFHFSFGKGTHDPAHGAVEFPTELTWLRRGYDSTNTEQRYEMETSEQSKPNFRVSIVNRDTN